MEEGEIIESGDSLDFVSLDVNKTVVIDQPTVNIPLTTERNSVSAPTEQHENTTIQSALKKINEGVLGKRGPPEAQGCESKKIKMSAPSIIEKTELPKYPPAECLSKMTNIVQPVQPSKSNNKAQSKLELAIAPLSYPTSKFSKNQMKYVQSSLVKEIDRIRNNELIPRFCNCKKEKGFLLVTCYDVESLTWLQKVTETLLPWPGLKLKAVDPAILHRLTKFSVWIPGPAEQPAKILLRLKKQNKGMQTEGWHLINRNIHTSGQRLVLLVDDEGVGALEEVKNYPFLNFERVLFKKLPDINEER